MKRYINHIVRSADKRVEHFLKTQITDKRRPDYGAMEGPVLEAKPAIYMLATAAAAYCCPDSRFFHDKKLLRAMNLAMDFVGRMQRDNGGIDFPSCNFNSAADTAFCFKRLIAGYRLLERYEKDSGEDMTAALEEKYLAVMKRALSMICEGGFHTPNHRWGITAALLQGAGLFAEDKESAKRLRERAGQYLGEGIDGNPDGEYAERSTGNYNAVVNNAMFAIYEELGDESYLGYAARNLDMMLYYIDPDDTIFTQNSTRQDQGKADYADKYFYQYLYMACAAEEKESPYSRYQEEFDRAAHKIIRDNMERGDLAPDCLHILMLHDAMSRYSFKGYGFVETYRKVFHESGVVRVKNPRFGYSILKEKSAFLFFQTGSMPMSVKIGESVGSERYFRPDRLREENGAWILEAELESKYYLPFHQPPATSDWWKMDHEKRKVLINSRMATRAIIKEEEDGLEVSVKTEGLDGVPVRIQVCVPGDSVLENSHICLNAHKGGRMVLKEGMVRVCAGDSAVEIGPGIGEHAFSGHYSGEESNGGVYTICLNCYSPFEHKFRIRVQENENGR